MSSEEQSCAAIEATPERAGVWTAKPTAITERSLRFERPAAAAPARSRW